MTPSSGGCPAVRRSFSGGASRFGSASHCSAAGGHANYFGLSERTADYLHRNRQSVRRKTGGNSYCGLTGRIEGLREAQNRRDDIHPVFARFQDLSSADFGCDDSTGRCDQHVAIGQHRDRLGQRARTGALGADVAGGGRHHSDPQDAANVVAVVLGTRAHPIFVI